MRRTLCLKMSMENNTQRCAGGQSRRSAAGRPCAASRPSTWGPGPVCDASVRNAAAGVTVRHRGPRNGPGPFSATYFRKTSRKLVYSAEPLPPGHLRACRRRRGAGRRRTTPRRRG